MLDLVGFSVPHEPVVKRDGEDYFNIEKYFNLISPWTSNLADENIDGADDNRRPD